MRRPPRDRRQQPLTPFLLPAGSTHNEAPPNANSASSKSRRSKLALKLDGPIHHRPWVNSSTRLNPPPLLAEDFPRLLKLQRGGYLTSSLTASGKPSTSSSPATSSPATGPLLPSPTPSSSCRPQSRAFDGQCEIRSDLEVTIKSINWEISELLEGNPYRERFSNGIFAHSFLSPAEYHRQYAPVGGVVLKARVISGQLYLEVNRKATEVRTLNLVPQRKLHSPHNHNHIRPHANTHKEGY
ncbi:hypothetical protein BGZ57DRAFT_364043 [Hyaloscypha finlandica]|nr:hypothetical protein BGZ57DRAFT_364043 [Hyaloscypha finlandica]